MLPYFLGFWHLKPCRIAVINSMDADLPSVEAGAAGPGILALPASEGSRHQRPWRRRKPPLCPNGFIKEYRHIDEDVDVKYMACCISAGNRNIKHRGTVLTTAMTRVPVSWPSDCHTDPHVDFPQFLKPPHLILGHFHAYITRPQPNPFKKRQLRPVWTSLLSQTAPSSPVSLPFLINVMEEMQNNA